MKSKMKKIARASVIWLLVLVIFAAQASLLAPPASAATVTIGHASISEKGTINGAKGDQTGKEVCTRTWYSKPWTAVIRPIYSSDAEKIAKAMEQACANDNIGYGQSDRTTLFTAAKAVGFNLSKVTTKVNTDCSALVAVCVNAAGISVSKDIYTGNEASALKATGRFTVYKTSTYTSQSGYLKRGDILLSGGHTAIVLSNGAYVSSSSGSSGSGSTSSSTSSKYFPACASSYQSIMDALISVGVNYTFDYAKKIAKANDITGYTGTAEQNIKLLNLLKKGKLIRPEDSSTSSKYFPACASSYQSLVDALISVGVNYTFDYAKKIAKANGITGYTGTAAQNIKMLNLLKNGKLIKP